MSRAERLVAWLEDTSDWLSPMVVKEVRQIVRGREFMYAFAASLLAGLAVAFFGAADALTGSGTAGRWTFGALMGCLAVLGFAVVPLGAFSALRIERMEQTFDLITLTALTPRRVVIGKLLAQTVKLVTLFAAVAPFIAMSFLLGGIDFITILAALVLLFMWSMWACAACLFLSALVRSRAMAGLVFGGAAFILLMVFTVGRMLLFFASMAAFPGAGPAGMSLLGSQPWWAFAIMATGWLATLVNLVLLAENRLALPTESNVTALRVGFLAQFLLIVGWTLSFRLNPPPTGPDALGALGLLGGLHLALVAMFAMTEELATARRGQLRPAPSGRWEWLLTILRPGGGRGALYVVAQMAILLLAALMFRPTGSQFRWFLALCGYICFFAGVPTLVLRSTRFRTIPALKLRVAILLSLAASLVLPDLLYYILWRPEVLELAYSTRHLVNPVRTLANWNTVEMAEWLPVPFGIGIAGVVASLVLFQMGRSETARAASLETRTPSTETREPGSADALY